MSKFLFSNQKENNITRKFYSDSYQLPENKINVQIKKLKLLKKFLKILLFTRFIQYYLRIMINLTKKFIKSFFLLRPRFLSTIFFIPLLYLIGWVLAQPLLLLDFQKENLSLIGTIFTFFLFIFLIPSWFNVRWKIRNTWEILGVNKNNFLQNIFDFSKGILFSIVLITLILIPILKSNYITWIGEFSSDILLNSILLGLGIGIAEEIIFRAWFLEELKMEYGIKIAIFTQALVFSLIHPISDNSFWNIIGLRLGWFFLAILLSLVRRKDKGSLWKCIGIHGGLVGIWFFINHGLIKIADNTPSFLAGPFTQNVSNPIGSFFAIVILIILCILYLGKSNNKAIL